MAREVEVVIRAQDQISKQMRAMSGNVKKSFGSMTKSALSFKGALAGIATGFVIKGLFEIGSELEVLNTQFETVLGTTEKAKKRLEELSNFAATTPFQLKNIGKASLVLENLTEGALSTGEGLRMVGDAAAIAGVPIQDLAVHVGRAFSALKANRPAGEAIARMQELGLITGKTRNQIEELTKVGLGTQAFELLQLELSKTSGGMEKLSKTGLGLVSTIKDQLAASIRDMLNGGLWQALLNILNSVTGALKRMIESGDFKRWAETIGNTVSFIANNFEQFALRTEIGFKSVALVVVAVYETLAQTVETAINSMVNAFNVLLPKSREFAEFDFASGFAGTKELAGEIEVLADRIATLSENQQGLVETAVESTTAAAPKIVANMDKIFESNQKLIDQKKKEKKLSKETQKQSVDNFNTQKNVINGASDLIEASFGRNKVTQALQAIANTALGVTSALSTGNIPLAFAVGAAGAAQVATIKGLADGGMIPGRNTVLTNDGGRGQEAVLNNAATNRLGAGGVNALNNRNVQATIVYSPTNNIQNDEGTGTSLVEVLQKDKQNFADFLQDEIIDKDYLRFA